MSWRPLTRACNFTSPKRDLDIANAETNVVRLEELHRSIVLSVTYFVKSRLLRSDDALIHSADMY